MRGARPRWLLLVVALAVVIVTSSGCFRLGKVVSERVHGVGETFDPGPNLIAVSYDPDGERGKEIEQPYCLIPGERGEPLLRPPRIRRRGFIRLEKVDPTHDLEIRYFVMNNPNSNTDFQEVFSVVGSVRGEWPNEVVFLEDVFPARRDPFVLYVRDLNNPHGGTLLGNADLILIRAQDRKTGEVQKVLFEYVASGPRVGVWTNILLSTGLVFPRSGETTSSAYATNLTFTLAFGWRTTYARGPLKWFGDNVSIVGSFGVGAINALDLEEFAFDFELVAGGGIQLLGLFSLQMLVNLTPLESDTPWSPTAFLVVGLNVTEVVRWGRRLLPRVFGPAGIRSLKRH